VVVVRSPQRSLKAQGADWAWVRRLAKVTGGWDARGVLERFTDGARAVVYQAIEEASERGHDRADVEHVLLGLLGEQDGVAARVLRSFGVTGERVRARLSETVPVSAQGPSPRGPFPLPFTPRVGGSGRAIGGACLSDPR
jgi:hypothetical protein